ncbi:MAG: glycosyltransferase family 39 protein [Candidatus Shapirobacteria bacterium]
MNILLASTLIFGLILRLISLNQSFWLDEAVQVWASSSFSLSKLLTQYMPGDFNPPLYHLALKGWIQILGNSEDQIRLLSVIFGIASLNIFYQILLELKLKKAWLPAMLLLATSPLHIYYSQEVRMYILAGLGFLLSLWRFLVFFRRKSLKNSIFLSLSFLVMAFSHFLALFTLPVFFFWGIGQERKNKKKNWVLFLFPFFILLVAYLAYSPLLLSQIKTGLGWQEEFPVWRQTVGSFSLKAAALLPLKFIIGRISFSPPWFYGAISVVLVILYWGLALLGIRKGKKIGRKWLLIFLLLAFPVLAGFLLSYKISVFSYFRFLYVLPLFYLLIGAGLEKMGRCLLFFSILFVGINLICTFIYLANPNFHRENWRGAVSWLHSQNQRFESSLIILPQIDKPFLYYDQGQTRLITADEAKDPLVYLASYSLPIFDPSDKIRKTLGEKGYKLDKGESFNQVGIELWRRE